MTVLSKKVQKNSITPGSDAPNWKGISRLGGLAACLIVFTALAEMAITFLPGGYTTVETVSDWFSLLHTNWFLGLRNLGLLNILMTSLGIPVIYALYVVHRGRNQTLATLAMIVGFIGIGTFYATNRAFPMLELSTRYAAATTDAQRAMLEAAGQALLSVGQSHTPGTFLTFFPAEIGGILMALAALQGRLFNRVTGLAGIAGYGFLAIYEILASFIPSAHDTALIFAMVGGLSNITWYVLVARRFFQLGSGANQENR